MATYKPKADFTIEAFQLKPNVVKPDWLTDCELVETLSQKKDDVELTIKTVNGSLFARKNDWIVKTHIDQILIYDDKVFSKYFEEVI